MKIIKRALKKTFKRKKNVSVSHYYKKATSGIEKALRRKEAAFKKSKQAQKLAESNLAQKKKRFTTVVSRLDKKEKLTKMRNLKRTAALGGVVTIGAGGYYLNKKRNTAKKDKIKNN